VSVRTRGLKAWASMAVHLEPRDIYLTHHPTSQGWGGALTFGRGLHAALQKRDLSTLLLSTGRPPPAPPAPDAPALVLDDAPPALLWRVRRWRAAARLAQQLRELPPPRRAFVCMTMPWALAARRTWPDVPLVYRVPCLLTHCVPFTWPLGRAPTVWKQLDYIAVCASEKAALEAADRVLVPTVLARDEVVALQPAAAAHTVVCPYGPPLCDLDAAVRDRQRAALACAPSTFVVLAVGLCDRNKAFDLAIRELVTTEPRVRLVIVGDGPERQALATLAAQLGVSRRVTLAGSQPDIVPWLAAADAVVSTSHYDAHPNAILEARAGGRPVLVPRHAPPRVYAGAAELVAGGGGLLYDRTCPGALAAAIHELSGNPARTAQLGQEARQQAAARAGWESCVDAILAGCPLPV
jgi:glycosyltransferase involved in cell wall biosynthesis